MSNDNLRTKTFNLELNNEKKSPIEKGRKLAFLYFSKLKR